MSAKQTGRRGLPPIPVLPSPPATPSPGSSIVDQPRSDTSHAPSYATHSPVPGFQTQSRPPSYTSVYQSATRLGLSYNSKDQSQMIPSGAEPSSVYSLASTSQRPTSPPPSEIEPVTASSRASSTSYHREEGPHAVTPPGSTPAFYYPSARTKARPRTSTPTSSFSGFRLKGKKKKQQVTDSIATVPGSGTEFISNSFGGPYVPRDSTQSSSSSSTTVSSSSMSHPTSPPYPASMQSTPLSDSQSQAQSVLSRWSPPSSPDISTLNLGQPSSDTNNDSVPAPIPSASAFYYPSARTKARPNAKPLKGKGKNVNSEEAEDFPQIPHIRLSPASSTSSSSFLYRTSTSTSADPTPSLRSSDSSGSSAQSTRPPLPLQNHAPPSSLASEAVSVSVSSPAPPPTFYYPSARTRAHPSKPTPGFKFKGKKKKQQPDHGGGESPTTPSSYNFLGLNLNLSKKKKQPEEKEKGRMHVHFDLKENVIHEDSQTHPDSNSTSVRARRQDSDTKVEGYPLDPYDSALLENDRHTDILLRRLSSRGSPTFHDYGRKAPSFVLDLGCGQGHWMLDAAATWKKYGTKIIGLDQVDVTKAAWAWADNGITDNIRFVRGDFVNTKLPFPNKFFDLVRMANLTLCIPYDKWEFVLGEAHRVLRIGGRLELIDDQVLFPYGKTLLPRSSSTSTLLAAKRNTLIPSSSLFPGNNDDDSLYDVQEEDEEDEEEEESTEDEGVYFRDESAGPAEGVSQYRSRHESLASTTYQSRGFHLPSPAPLIDPPVIWLNQASASSELENVFVDVLDERYGIHLRPALFVTELIGRMFGNANKAASMHLMLAPPDINSNQPSSTAGSQYGTQPSSLSQCPGLILWPSTFIEVPQAELEMHAFKHMRVLLGCKTLLADYVKNMNRDGEAPSVNDSDFLEIMWEYECFLRQRFEWPYQGVEPEEEPEHEETPPDSVDGGPRSESRTDSSGASILSTSTILSDEFNEALWEYQSEFRERFDWAHKSRVSMIDYDDGRESATPTPRTPSLTSSSGFHGGSISPPMPQYAREELTHVRSFRVFEATKMSDVKLF